MLFKKMILISNKIALIVVAKFLYIFTEAFTWISYPTSASGIQGQNVIITWILGLSALETWTGFNIYQHPSGSVNQEVVGITRTPPNVVVKPAFQARESDISLNVSVVDTNATIKFTLKNLVKATDEANYEILVLTSGDFGQAPAAVTLTINSKFIFVLTNLISN
jgi:hypothetical protein